MNGKDLLRAMQEIDDMYVWEGEEKMPKRKIVPLWAKCLTGAACLAAVSAVVFTLLPGKGSGTPVPGGATDPSYTQMASAPKETEGTQAASTEAPEPAESTVEISMEDIVVNENCAFFIACFDFDQAKENPDSGEPNIWGPEELTAYYGWNLQPKYIPQELMPDWPDGAVHAYQPSCDPAYMGYNRDFSYGETTGGNAARCFDHRRGFYLLASKNGLFETDFSVFKDETFSATLPEEEIKVTNLNGAEVIFGHVYEYTCLDPARGYDSYAAKFSLGDTEYRLIASDISLEETVKIVASILYDTGNIVLK